MYKMYATLVPEHTLFLYDLFATACDLVSKCLPSEILISLHKLCIFSCCRFLIKLALDLKSLFHYLLESLLIEGYVTDPSLHAVHLYHLYHCDKHLKDIVLICILILLHKKFIRRDVITILA
jgi:hypothetical protein